MQVFPRSAIESHAVGAAWPEFLGSVQLGESFVIETERYKPVNGPIRIEGVAAGDALAVQIEAIEMVGPYEALTQERGEEPQRVALELRDDGCFYFPRNFRLEARPTIGNIGVLPQPSERVLADARRAAGDGSGLGWRALMTAPQGDHCHSDCPWLAAGATIHLKARVDGAGLCLSDAHGYQPSGRLAYAGIDVSANVQVRVLRSEGWLVKWPLIETADEVMVLVSTAHTKAGMDARYEEVAEAGYRALREVVAARMGCSEREADQIVATGVDIRNCALLGLGAAPADDEPGWQTSVAAALRKSYLLPRR
jgi:acetamidase/formamidase